jgi:hypothetical protein
MTSSILSSLLQKLRIVASYRTKTANKQQNRTKQYTINPDWKNNTTSKYRERVVKSRTGKEQRNHPPADAENGGKQQAQL